MTDSQSERMTVDERRLEYDIASFGCMPDGGHYEAPPACGCTPENEAFDRLRQAILEEHQGLAARAADRLEDLMGYRESDYNDYDPAPDRDLIRALRAVSPTPVEEGGAA